MIALLLLVACASEPPAGFKPYAIDVMATRLDLLLPSTRGSDAAADAVFAAFRQVEEDANEWRPGTPLARVNAAGGEPVPVPAETLALIRRGLELGALTDGAFDVTWAALWGVWDFDEPAVPEADVIAERVAHVDWRRVVVGDGAVRLPDPEMRLGLGGIAKGYAMQRAVDALAARGVRDYCLSAGQVTVGGLRDGRPWRVGVRDPRGGPSDLIAVLEVTDASVSTSGDYERFFEHGGVRYHHILDPRTGWPARGVRSATVVSPDPTLADALSTAMVVMGVARALALAEARDDVDALLVDDQGRVFVSGLEGRIRWGR